MTLPCRRLYFCQKLARFLATVQLIERPHLFHVFREVVDAEVVDHVPGADEQRGPVRLQQLEVVLVGLVAQEAPGVT